MAKYYIRSGWVRLVLDAWTARDAALKAIQWSLDGRAEVFREPERDRMREVEALEFQLDDKIEVSEVGFRSGSGQVFSVLDLPAVRPVARSCSAEAREAG
ncbi:MAG: hypothetical protein GX575_19825 [Candidatus Anammoximicrobium sp.]|nr:hypothetical protein [Candidatus Anammoximicrobium sp.]